MGRQSGTRKNDGLGVSVKARIISGVSVIAACSLALFLVPRAVLMQGRFIDTAKHGRVFYSHGATLAVVCLIGIFLAASGVVDYIRRR